TNYLQKKLLICISRIGKHGERGTMLLNITASHSHRVALQPLVNALADRGHEVSFYSTIKPHPEMLNPKVKEVCPESVREAHGNMSSDIATRVVLARLRDKHSDLLMSGTVLFDAYVDSITWTVNNQDFAQWIKNEKFDLIIHDNPLGQFAYGVAYEMKAKIVAFISTSTPTPGDAITFGFPEESSWLPSWSSGSGYWFIPDHYAHVYNNFAWYFSHNWYLLPKLDALHKQLYGKDLPPTQQLMKKVDLVLLNEHVSCVFAKALPPYVIPVGGMHVKESNGTLPQNIESFLKTKDRFIFISFGSIIKVSDLPPEAQKMLFDSVASFEDTNFLWKWEGAIPEGLPKNVFAMNWFPQQDVLAHPKCKGFVTQGGVISYQQAMFHGVPLIVIPAWGDQGYVGRVAEYHGVGIFLELADVTYETFTKALHELLHNDRYVKNVKEVSRRFKDRPMSSVDTAVWWTEYVLRHDTGHLKSPGVQQYWWQRALLDFWGAVLG
ncbi:unnamed protein product, partial [Allacma fusca]